MTEEEAIKITESFEFIRMLKAALSEVAVNEKNVWLNRFYKIGLFHSRYVRFRDGYGDVETCPLLYWCAIKLRKLNQI